MVKYGRAGQATDDNIIQRMCFACWITKATDTLRVCSTYCFSTAKMVVNTPHCYVYTYIASLVGKLFYTFNTLCV